MSLLSRVLYHCPALDIPSAFIHWHGPAQPLYHFVVAGMGIAGALVLGE